MREQKTVSVEKTASYGNKKWWENSGKEMASSVFAEAMTIQSNYSFFYRNMLLNLSVYNSSQPSWSNGFLAHSGMGDALRLNANYTCSAVDTLVSKICKQTPTIQLLTVDGDYKQQQKAKNLGRFIEGRFHYEKVDKIAERAFLEGCINGTSGIIMRIKEGRVTYELVRPQQMRMSVDSAIADKPESYHFIFYRNRYQLAQEYPDKAVDIFKAANSYDLFVWDRMSRIDEDVVPVIESYSMFSKKRALCVDGSLLLEEPWELKNEYGEIIPPVAWFRYKPSDRNMFGKGLVEEVRTLQWEADKILRSVAKATHLVCVPKILVNTSANLLQSEVNNEIGRMNWSGEMPPQPFQLGAVPKDYYEQLEWYAERIYAISGVSQLSAVSKKPAGLDSGKALENYYDIESDRFQNTARQFEEFYLQLYDITIRITKMIPDKAAINSYYIGRNMKKQIDWSDVDMDADQLRMAAWPVSDLPDEPAGKLAYVQQMMALGMMDQSAAWGLMDLPDTDAYSSLVTSQRNYVLKQLSDIADGAIVIPEINQDLEMASTLAKQAYFDYKSKGLGAKELLNMLNYIQQIDNVKIEQMAQQQFLMQAAMAQQTQQIGAQNGSNPSYGTNSGYGIAPEPNAATISALTGQ